MWKSAVFYSFAYRKKGCDRKTVWGCKKRQNSCQVPREEIVICDSDLFPFAGPIGKHGGLLKCTEKMREGSPCCWVCLSNGRDFSEITLDPISPCDDVLLPPFYSVNIGLNRKKEIQTKLLWPLKSGLSGKMQLKAALILRFRIGSYSCTFNWKVWLCSLKPQELWR